ncbi:hypothetical protein [Mycolicibacterium baixiangningiae]|nr:hypothetical protein [Mycolicibacterium baixiangningiae]
MRRNRAICEIILRTHSATEAVVNDSAGMCSGVPRNARWHTA